MPVVSINYWVFEVHHPDGTITQLDFEGIQRIGLRADSVERDHWGSLREAPFAGDFTMAESEALRRAHACLAMTGVLPSVWVAPVMADGLRHAVH